MVSIIVCSRKSSLSNTLQVNIKNTVGETFEIICIANTDNRLSIFEAYNQGVEQAHGEILVFMHDDVVFQTQDWGQIITKCLEDNQTAIAGVLGGQLIDETSYSWTSSGFYSGQVVQVSHGTKTKYNHNGSNMGNEVVALDGMFLAMRKELFEKQILKWDTVTYDGFHFYDLDICMQAVSQGYKVQVVPIMIEHHSLGAFNLSFYDSCKAFHQKWDSRLPVKTRSITSEQQRTAYQKALEKICAQGKVIATSNNIMKRTPYKIITKLLLLCGIDPYQTNG